MGLLNSASSLPTGISTTAQRRLQETSEPPKNNTEMPKLFKNTVGGKVRAIVSPRPGHSRVTPLARPR
eukprot:4913742-Pyramimonas_sp.AAC.1